MFVTIRQAVSLILQIYSGSSGVRGGSGLEDC